MRPTAPLNEQTIQDPPDGIENLLLQVSAKSDHPSRGVGNQFVSSIPVTVSPVVLSQFRCRDDCQKTKRSRFVPEFHRDHTFCFRGEDWSPLMRDMTLVAVAETSTNAKLPSLAKG